MKKIQVILIEISGEKKIQRNDDAVKVKAATLTRSDGEEVRSARTREAEAVDLRREEKAIC